MSCRLGSIAAYRPPSPPWMQILEGARLESFKKVHPIQGFEEMKAMRGEHGCANGDPRAI